MKKLAQQFHTFGVDSTGQTVLEAAILGIVMMLTVAFGFLLAL